ncbi:hypothetical protein MTYP_01506 [Methylophilaceae bacterium]|nr:hypothetical protein MTYP_01506 [Methylophilaceae bacterium]
MATTKEKTTAHNQFDQTILLSADEQKWEDIAGEEYEVSSDHSPVADYFPRVLFSNRDRG